MGKKTCVLDASVLLHDPDAIHRFNNHLIILPSVVLEELDRKKAQHDEIGRNARQVMRFIDNVSKLGDIRKGVDLEKGGTVKIFLDPENRKKKGFPLQFAPDRARNRLLTVTHKLGEVGEKVFLVSKDPVTKIMAETIGIQTQNYKSTKDTFDTIRKGVNYLDVTKDLIDRFYLEGSLPLPEGDFLPNDFYVLRSEENSSAVVRVDIKQKALVPLSRSSGDIWGVKPRNVEQKCAFDLLLRDEIKLVTFVGNAGTGKTLLALAAALRKTFDEGVYRRILIARSIMPLGRDIGFLPGTKEEKLHAWLAPFFDNLDHICATSKDDSGSETKRWILESEKFQVESITYMRGRSLADSFVIIDEAQNLTPHEIKTIISRVGENTKIVVLGDPTQIDNPYLDADSNGLIYLISRMKKYDLSGSIYFQHTERSRLAAVIAEAL